MGEAVTLCYLALAVAIAISATAALVRVPAGLAGIVYFFIGFPAFHFSGPMLIATATATFLAAWFGAWASWAGRIGLAFAVAAFAMLIANWARSQRIAVPLDAALDDVFGNALDAGGHGPETRASVSAAFPRIWSNPLRTRCPGVECLENLSYGDAGERNLLDIYRPVRAPRDGGLPVLLWIHGGGWIIGHKAQQGLPLMYYMASRGWLAVSANYRLGPASRFPDPLVDIKKVIAWLRRHGEDYGADARCIVTCGGSAGAHLASLAALTPNRPELQPGFEDQDTTVAASVPLYGRFDFVDRSEVLGDKLLLMNFLADKVMPCTYEDDRALWDLASPIAQVHASAPPMLIMHGTHDSLIPIEEARSFVDALQRTSTQPVVFAQLQGAQHAWDLFHTPWSLHTARTIYRFAELCRDRSARGPA